MNDRNQEVGTIAVIIGGVLFLGVILLMAAGMIGWMFARSANKEAIKAERAAQEARQAQIQALKNEAANPQEVIEDSQVNENKPE